MSFVIVGSSVSFNTDSLSGVHILPEGSSISHTNEIVPSERVDTSGKIEKVQDVHVVITTISLTPSERVIVMESHSSLHIQEIEYQF